MVVKCECCEEVITEEVHVFSIELETYSNKLETYNLVCNKCVSAWFIECPEDIIRMEVKE